MHNYQVDFVLRYVMDRSLIQTQKHALMFALMDIFQIQQQDYALFLVQIIIQYLCMKMLTIKLAFQIVQKAYS